MFRLFAFVCATTLVPGGASGVDLKSNSPKTNVCAEMFVLVLEDRNIFRVITACGINLSHSLNGKDGSQDANPALKWDLNVCMVLPLSWFYVCAVVLVDMIRYLN